MKKILSTIALATIGLSAFAGGPAALWTPQSFLTGQMLYITNNSTVTNPGYFTFLNGGVGPGLSGTNPYISIQSANVLSGYTNTVLSTNGTTVITNSITVTPYWANFPNPIVPPILNGDVQSNISLTIAMDYTNILLGPNQPQFLPLYGTPTNYFTPNASNLNVMTFVFLRGTTGPFGVDNYMNYGTGSQDTWSFTLTNVASTGTTWVTNLPDGFCRGANRIMLWKITAGSSANSQGVMINEMYLGSFPNAQ